MKKKLILTCVLIVIPFLTQAQTVQPAQQGEGKFILTTFGNLYTGFGHNNDDRGIEIERAYLGYQYKFSNGIELKTVADFGQSKNVSDMQRIGFLKNAYIGWSKNGWKIYGGLITTTQFKTQEDFWGKRYIMKSFQDEYKMGSSADAGISVTYKFNDRISADAIVANGEGYKKIQFGKGLLYGLGVTLKPLEGLTIRAYGSYNEKADSDNTPGEKGITNLAGFAGYKHKTFSIGAEYNFQMHSDNVEDNNKYGTSVYATIPVGKKVNLFGRWDYLSSNNGWNVANDGMAGVAGVEIVACKQLKLSPTFRIWSPDNNNSKKDIYALINASFSL